DATLTETEEVRLVGGSKPGEGIVQVWFNGSWGYINQNQWNWRSTRVACRELGFICNSTSFMQFPLLVLPPTGLDMPIFLSWVQCIGNETRLLDCPATVWSGTYSKGGFSAVQGLRRVRLVGANSSLEGRVEVFGYEAPGGVSQWGTIYDDGWDDLAANVVCRSLGWLTGRALTSSGYIYGQGGLPLLWKRPMIVTDVDCTGTETSLLECPSSGLGQLYGNDYSQTAGVVCRNDPLPMTGSVRLLYGATPAEGRLQIFYNNTWGYINEFPESGWQPYPLLWDDMDSTVICRTLGFRSGIARSGRGWSGSYENVPIWLSGLTCFGNETSLLDCLPENQFHPLFNVPAAHMHMYVRCAENISDGQLRLFGKMSPNRGRLEVAFNGAWGVVDSGGW
ncbi:hypothetical protein VOLCADRAFT_30475, partial [Volvox carteri f. nagariensis]